MRKSGIFRADTAVLSMLLAGSCVTGLTACSPSQTAADAGRALLSHTHITPKAAPRTADSLKPGAEELSEMVSAVAPSKSGSSVEVKFALVQKPEVGQPLNLDVAVVLGQPLPNAVSIAFQSSDGLEIIEGADAVSFEKPAEGTPIRRTVKLLPQKDGIFAVNALVTLTQPHDAPVRTFSIPVIAGQGVPELTARAETKKGQ